MKDFSNYHPVDQLGALLAQIAELETKAKAIKAQLSAQGDGAYEGDFYRVTVSTADRDTLDMEAVRAKLSPQFIRCHTNTKSVTTVRCVARKGLPVAA